MSLNVIISGLCVTGLGLCLLVAQISASTDTNQHTKDVKIDSRHTDMSLRLILLADYLEKFKDLERMLVYPRDGQDVEEDLLDNLNKAEANDTSTSSRAETNEDILEDNGKMVLDKMHEDNKLVKEEMKQERPIVEAAIVGRPNNMQTEEKVDILGNAGTLLDDAVYERIADEKITVPTQQSGSLHDKIENQKQKVFKDVEALLQDLQTQNPQNIETNDYPKIDKKSYDYAILPPASEWCRMMGFRRCGSS